MAIPVPDQRTPSQRARDEAIASEPQLAPPDLPPNAAALPLESHLGRRRHPVAVAGVVENGVVRPLDPSVKLLERSRVIIVSTEAG